MTQATAPYTSFSFQLQLPLSLPLSLPKSSREDLAIVHSSVRNMGFTTARFSLQRNHLNNCATLVFLLLQIVSRNCTHDGWPHRTEVSIRHYVDGPRRRPKVCTHLEHGCCCYQTSDPPNAMARELVNGTKETNSSGRCNRVKFLFNHHGHGELKRKRRPYHLLLLSASSVEQQNRCTD